MFCYTDIKAVDWLVEYVMMWWCDDGLQATYVPYHSAVKL